MTTRPEPLDHGVLSGIRRRSTPRQARKDADWMERSIDHAVAVIAAEKEAERKQAIAAYKEATRPVPFNSDDLHQARAIRTSTGWHRVVKVNKKSVTVETGYSWTDRYPIENILEVKA